MKRLFLGPIVIGVCAAALLAVLSAGIVGCKKETDHKDHADHKTTASAEHYANTRCPIMNNPIDPTDVPPALVREYKGKKVAFCCGGCPAQWDKLTDAEKDAKLEAAK